MDILEGVTSLPWEAADKGDYSDFDGDSIVILGDDRRVCVVRYNENDAAYIVHAANNYPKLHRALTAIANCKQGDLTKYCAEVDGLAIEALAALSQAKGGKTSECEDCDGFGRVHNNGETDSPMFVQCETCGDERGQP